MLNNYIIYFLLITIFFENNLLIVTVNKININLEMIMTNTRYNAFFILSAIISCPLVAMVITDMNLIIWRLQNDATAG